MGERPTGDGDCSPWPGPDAAAKLRRMTEIREHDERQRALERRHERQGWLLLTGGFAVAGLLIVGASFL